MTTRGWDPFRELNALRETLDQFLEDSIGRPAPGGHRVLPVDVYQTETDVYVVAPIPGVRPEDVEIHFVNGALTLRGESKPPYAAAERDVFVRELRYGPFQRQVDLPVQVLGEQAEAKVEHGILTVRLPKVEDVRPKTIKVEFS